MICPTCDQLSDLLDGAIPLLTAWRLRLHIRQCSDCSHHLLREEQLRDQVRSLGATVTAPASLRYRVATAIHTDPVAPREKPYRPTARQYVISFVTCCLILGLLYLISISQLLHPTPAYSQVVNAMRQVKTARWRETLYDYDSRTGKGSHFELRKFARMNPPALMSEYPPGCYRVQTAETDVAGNVTTNPAVIARQEKLLRLTIQYQLAAPESLGKGTNAVRVDRVMVNGQLLFRFTSGMGEGRHTPPEAKLTKPGYRTVLWVNPTTLRVVRSEQEYYDGQHHSRTVASGFEYNQPLPANSPLK